MNNICFFERKIVAWYVQNGRKNLLWRKKNVSVYEVWVSEIMLQQTQVNRVEKFYLRFIQRFPDIFALAQAQWREFLSYWRGLGYYGRGRNMLKTAAEVVKKYNGHFPCDKRLLKELPGIGEYTACALLIFGFRKNYLAFDTNFQRVLGRFLKGSRRAILSPEDKASFKIPTPALNAAIMDFGSSLCTLLPKCQQCPLATRCVYFKEKGIRETTVSIKRVSFPTKKAQVFLWLHKNHREYYSQSTDILKPFVLPHSINTRAKIKKYFKKKYRLEISVRPPHKKTYIQRVPTIFVNAQILSGKHQFHIFKKSSQ